MDRSSLNPLYAGVVLSLFITLTGCTPQRPEIINRTHDSGSSPTIFVVGDRKTTRKELNDEIESMPTWLRSRFQSTNGEGIYMSNALKRAILFRDAGVARVDETPESYKRYEAFLLDWYLNEKTHLPAPSDDERLALLQSEKGHQKYDTRPVYVIYTVSLPQAQRIYQTVVKANPQDRLKIFKEQAVYGLNPFNLKDFPLVGEFSETSYNEARVVKPFSFLTKIVPPLDIKKHVVGLIGPFDFKSPEWSVTKPQRDAKLWKIYLLGPVTIAADLFKTKKDDLPLSKIDADVFQERRKKIVEGGNAQVLPKNREESGGKTP